MISKPEWSFPMKDAVQQDFKNADVAVELVRILFFGLSGTPQRRLVVRPMYPPRPAPVVLT